MAHAYALARELAQPVARGYLSLTEAHIALLTGSVRAERRGELAPFKAADVFRLQRHLLGLHLERLMSKRDIAEMRIKQRVRPLIASLKPPNVVLAEANDVNGAEGFPFDEVSVNDIARGEVYFARRQRRHG
jgi:hypothetical protein